ncbi:MAG: endonuclease/exonuclease/phosphatase family protein, partial [Acidimicrobiales bacterium]
MRTDPSAAPIDPVDPDEAAGSEPVVDAPTDAPDGSMPEEESTAPDDVGGSVPPRLAAAVSGSLIVFGCAATALFLIGVRTTSLQFIAPVMLAVAGVGDLLMIGLAFLAVLGWILIATFASATSTMRWLGLALIPWLAAVQIWWPVGLGIVRPEDPVAGRELTVLSQNLWIRNTDPDALARRVMEEGADVLVLTEFTGRHEDAFRAAGAMDRYPYQVLKTLNNPNGMAVLSRVPIVRHDDLGLTVPGLGIELRTPGGPLQLFAVHLPAPTRGHEIDRWRQDFATLTHDACRAGDR